MTDSELTDQSIGKLVEMRLDERIEQLRKDGAFSGRKPSPSNEKSDTSKKGNRKQKDKSKDKSTNRIRSAHASPGPPRPRA